MPGDFFMSQQEYGAGAGYAYPFEQFGMTGQAQQAIVAGGGGHSHTSFLLWLLVIVGLATLSLHGFRVAGFTFLFRR